MAVAAGPRSTTDGAVRFHLAVQRSRAAVISMMGVVALAARLLGVIDFDWTGALAAWATGLASTVAVAALVRRRRFTLLGAPTYAWWMGLDVLLTCWTIWLIRDRSPLWMIWFLTNTTAAAFVAGRRAALAVALGASAAYLAVCVVLGEIRGLDATLARPVGRLALLFGGTWFMIAGIADLRARRREIARLMDEKTQQLEELSRLTDELHARSRELADANLRIAEANRAKSQFLANMSHELRTPLNSIIGFSEILSDKLEPRLEPRFHRFLQNILGSGRHLLSLINDILDLSKIEAGRMELLFEPVSLADVVHGVESVMHGIAAKRGIAIESRVAPDLPPIVADPPRVKQILYNLLANAVKFSRDGQTVEIEARPLAAGASPLGAPAVEIAVADHGVGIRREDQETTRRRGVGR